MIYYVIERWITLDAEREEHFEYNVTEFDSLYVAKAYVKRIEELKYSSLDYYYVKIVVGKPI